MDLGAGPLAPSVGDTFDVLGAADIDAAALTLDADPGFTFGVVSEGPGQVLRLTVVPEPPALLLLAVGGLFLAGGARRRFRRGEWPQGQGL